MRFPDHVMVTRNSVERDRYGMAFYVGATVKLENFVTMCFTPRSLNLIIV